MKTFLKLALYLSGALIVVLVASGLWLARLDANDYKDWIAAKVEERTGRSLALGGNISFSLYPWLGIVADDVRLGNAVGFGDAPFFQARQLAFRIKTLPLLRDRYEIDTASVQGAVLNLARNAQGSNWADLTRADKAQDPSPPSLAAIVIGGLDIRDAEINWEDQTSATRYSFADINMRTGELVYGAPVAVSLALNVAANRPALSASIQLDNTITYDSDNELYTIEDLNLRGVLRGDNIPGGSSELALSARLELDLAGDSVRLSDLQLGILGLDVAGDISSRRLQSARSSVRPSIRPSVQASLKVTGDDLVRLLKIAELEPLASQLADLPVRSFSLDTQVDADMESGNIDIARFSAAMLGADISGALKTRNARSESGEYKGRIAASGPNLPALIQLAAQLADEDSALAHFAGQVAAAKGNNKAFRVSSDFAVDMQGGNIDIPVLSLKALGLDISGQLQARDMQAGAGTVEGSLSVKSAQPRQVLTAIGQAQLAEILSSVDLAASIRGSFDNLALQPLRLDARFLSRGGQNSAAPLALSVRADTRIDLAAESLSLNKLAIKGLGKGLGPVGLDLSARLTVDKFRSEQNFRGEVNVAAFNPRRLLRQLHQEVPQMADQSALSKLALSARFEGTKDALDIRELDLLLDESRLSGSFALDDYASRAYRFALDIDQINIDRYLPPVADEKAQATTALPLQLLRGLDMNGELAATQLRAAGLALEDVAARLEAKAGEIRLEGLRARLYEGDYQGDIKLDAAAKLPRLTLNSTLKGVQLEALLRDLVGFKDLVGRGDASIAVLAAGADTAAFKQTLNGMIELRMGKGLLRDLDVPKVLQQVEMMIESKRLGPLDKSGVTHFDSLSASLPLTAGVISNEDLLLQAPGFQLRGSGVLARLADMSWDYNLDVAVTEQRSVQGAETYNLGGYTIPIQCRGKIAGQNCTPDLGGLGGMALQKIILDKLSNGQREDKEAEQDTDPRKELLDKVLRGIFN